MRNILKTRSAMALAAVLLITLIAFAATRRGSDATLPQQTTSTETMNDSFGTEVSWLAAMLNGGAKTLTEADLAPHTSPDLLAVLPAPVLIGTLQQLSALGPFI